MKAIQLPNYNQIMVIVILIATCLACCSCSSTKAVTQQVRDVHTDTVYLSNLQYDSIYVYQEHNKDYRKGITNPSSLIPNLSPDTVYLKDVSVEYRYRVLKDTVRIVERDSIPYQVTITEVKEITRPLTWFDHLTRASFWFILGGIICIVFRKLKSLIIHL